MTRLLPERTLLLVVDVQEKLAAAMPEAQRTAMVRAATILIESASFLGARVIATEQYPQGLGPTLGQVRTRLDAVRAVVLSKTDFSACDAPGFPEALSGATAPSGPPPQTPQQTPQQTPPQTLVKSVVVLGMETHVGVFQTVRDLVARGLDVHVPLDGVASRRDDHRAAGLDLCRSAGATITTAETVVFDWLARAGGDSFRAVSRLVR